ncbi:type IV secretory system conjugative DNA transfer family protein (plasmid) [Gordonia hongkongensis]|uniref:type IV secretory system conjugative DNA transfer family protein n=1 Tax=Gordonia TaxID=2053 RepID=UPI0030CADF9A
MSTGKAASGNTETQLRIAGAVVVLIVATCLAMAVASTLGVPRWVVIAVAVGITAVVATAIVATRRWWGQSAAMRALRDTTHLGDVTGKGALTKGAELRGIDTDSDDGRTTLASMDVRDVAMCIGRVGKNLIFKTLEDFTLIIMGPRSNKTSSQAIPRILSALGSVVATSNKPDVWILTAHLRGLLGPVYTYDPAQIAFVEQTWWWNILGDVRKYSDARRIATHFMAATGKNNSESGNSGFFNSSSKQLLARMILAAAVSGNTMREVITWVDTQSHEPVDLLAKHGHQRIALSLESQLELVPETLSGVVGGASAALECLQDEDALRWITPPDSWDEPPAEPIEELDLWTLFTASPGHSPTLYLMTRDDQDNADPVTAAIVDQVFKLSNLAASAHGGRLDPPLTMVLDEAANICRIENLPALASFAGSQAVIVDVILQSYQQGMGVWGREKMGAMWGASTCRIIGAGLQDRDDARMVSDLIGTHEVWKDSYTYSSGSRSRSRSLVREPIMPLEEVAALDRNNALLIRQGSRPILMDLMPWYREDAEAADIKTYAKTATAQVRRSAVAALEDNALGRHLRDLDEPAPAAAHTTRA